MNLHYDNEAFESLASIAAEHIHISVDNIKRDYLIVLVLKQLSESEYFDCCVFKGGTSLSKCYPGSINRFSEDIDLTFIGCDEYTNSRYDKTLKKIEEIMTAGLDIEKIESERNQRNKSSWVYFKRENDIRIKLEIGSSVRPDPYKKATIKSYIQEYLESVGMDFVCQQYGLREIEINVLNIERTFLDKVMAVKRHAICGTLSKKVRHIYDVVMLFSRDDIKAFLSDTANLKTLLIKTKETDGFYLQKRNVNIEYNPLGPYAFDEWADKFDETIKTRYLNLPKELLFDKNTKLSFDVAIKTFLALSNIFNEIGE